MTKITENDLEFDFSGSVSAFQYDDSRYHGCSTMKRVDFIVEYDECYRFIEVKDPDCPDATQTNRDNFALKFRNGNLIPELAGKYRDSLLFFKLQEKKEKNIQYLVLLSMSSLDAAMLLTKGDELRRVIPIGHVDWAKDSVSRCVILNLETWKQRFGNASVKRLSEQGV